MKIELPVDAHLPHDYVASERLRLEMYKRLAEVRPDEDVALLREELVDRYGEPPEAVRSLLEVALLRARARQAGLTDITIQGNYVRFAPVELPESGRAAALPALPAQPGQAAGRTILVPRPTTAPVAGQPIRGRGAAGLGARGRSTPCSTGRPCARPGLTDRPADADRRPRRCADRGAPCS